MSTRREIGYVSQIVPRFSSGRGWNGGERRPIARCTLSGGGAVGWGVGATRQRYSRRFFPSSVDRTRAERSPVDRTRGRTSRKTVARRFGDERTEENTGGTPPARSLVPPNYLRRVPYTLGLRFFVRTLRETNRDRP